MSNSYIVKDENGILHNIEKSYTPPNSVGRMIPGEDIRWIEQVDNLVTEQHPVWAVDVNGDIVLDTNGNQVQSTDVNGNLVFDSVVMNYGKILVVNDATKAAVQAQDVIDALQKVREGKLEAIRATRNPLMKDVDIMVNEIALGDRVDIAAVKAYRDSLKAITDAYKDVNGDVTPAIDALADDLSDLVLPVKP